MWVEGLKRLLRRSRVVDLCVIRVNALKDSSLVAK